MHIHHSIKQSLFIVTTRIREWYLIIAQPLDSMAINFTINVKPYFVAIEDHFICTWKRWSTFIYYLICLWSSSIDDIDVFRCSLHTWRLIEELVIYCISNGDFSTKKFLRKLIDVYFIVFICHDFSAKCKFNDVARKKKLLAKTFLIT